MRPVNRRVKQLFPMEDTPLTPKKFSKQKPGSLLLTEEVYAFGVSTSQVISFFRGALQQIVLNTISAGVDLEGDTLWCAIPQETLATYLGLDVRVLERSMKKLTTLGVLKSMRCTQGIKGCRKQYTLNYDRLEALLSQFRITREAY